MNVFDKSSLYFSFLEVQRLHYYLTHVMLDEIGVYPGQPPMLFILNKYDGMSQKELAEKLKLKPATITVMLKRMEKANLVVRRQDTEDQRVSRVFITEEGRKTCIKAIEVMRNVERECFGGLSSGEKETLKELFNKMKDNLIKATPKIND